MEMKDIKRQWREKVVFPLCYKEQKINHARINFAIATFFAIILAKLISPPLLAVGKKIIHAYWPNLMEHLPLNSQLFNLLLVFFGVLVFLSPIIVCVHYAYWLSNIQFTNLILKVKPLLVSILDPKKNHLKEISYQIGNKMPFTSEMYKYYHEKYTARSTIKIIKYSLHLINNEYISHSMRFINQCRNQKLLSNATADKLLQKLESAQWTIQTKTPSDEEIVLEAIKEITSPQVLINKFFSSINCPSLLKTIQKKWFIAPGNIDYGFIYWCYLLKEASLPKDSLISLLNFHKEPVNINLAKQITNISVYPDLNLGYVFSLFSASRVVHLCSKPFNYKILLDIQRMIQTVESFNLENIYPKKPKSWTHLFFHLSNKIKELPKSDLSFNLEKTQEWRTIHRKKIDEFEFNLINSPKDLYQLGLYLNNCLTNPEFQYIEKVSQGVLIVELIKNAKPYGAIEIKNKAIHQVKLKNNKNLPYLEGKRITAFLKKQKIINQTPKEFQSKEIFHQI